MPIDRVRLIDVTSDELVGYLIDQFMASQGLIRAKVYSTALESRDHTFHCAYRTILYLHFSNLSFALENSVAQRMSGACYD